MVSGALFPRNTSRELQSTRTQADGGDQNTQYQHTTYVISCPTGQADCAIAPNITLTEGVDLAKWTSTTSGADVAGYALSLLPLGSQPGLCS